MMKLTGAAIPWGLNSSITEQAQHKEPHRSGKVCINSYTSQLLLLLGI